MAYCRSRDSRRPARAAMEDLTVLRRAAEEVRAAAVSTPMEADVPMRHYQSPNAVPGTARAGAWCTCAAQEERALLEQLVELNCSQNQLLIDLLGAVNSLTAALLTAQAKV